jgi:outer membrane protein OmpA-like peptidoglycan-associated protein
MSEAVRTTVKAPETKKENQVSQVQKGNFYQPVSSPVEQILFLQRTIGNKAVQRLMKSGALQAKLRIGAPGDVYEHEADRVADAVMRMPEPQALSSGAPGVQRACPKCEEEDLRRQPVKEEEELHAKKVSDSNSELDASLEAKINAVQTGGQPLSESARAFFEPRFGYDFSGVRIHADAKASEAARAVNARAFTVGRDVVFGEGEYTPRTIEGQRLMAHELTHAVQQSGGLVQPQIQCMGDPSQLPSGLACPVAHDSPGVSDLDIIFRVNSANLSSSDEAAIDNFVNNWHASGANENLRLDGYASPEGTDNLNWTLSCNRAMAVKNALTSPASGGPGIPASYIEMFAHGETSEFAAAYSPNRRVSIQMRGGSPNPIPPKPIQTRVIPCTAMPREIFNRGACGTGADFRANDFPPLIGTNAAQRAAVWEADHLTLDFQLRNRMRLELGGLAGAEGLRMVTHFSGGTGTRLTHDSSSTLGADALVCGTFSRLHASVIREIERQLISMDAAGVIDCNAITLPMAGVPAVSFGFSDSTALKAIIGGTQGLSIRITRFSINPGSRTYDIEFHYLICDDFGVDTTDLYSPALIAFWVLQHRRSGNAPFINELDLLKAELGHY